MRPRSPSRSRRPRAGAGPSGPRQRAGRVTRSLLDKLQASSSFAEASSFAALRRTCRSTSPWQAGPFLRCPVAGLPAPGYRFLRHTRYVRLTGGEGSVRVRARHHALAKVWRLSVRAAEFANKMEDRCPGYPPAVRPSASHVPVRVVGAVRGSIHAGKRRLAWRPAQFMAAHPDESGPPWHPAGTGLRHIGTQHPGSNPKHEFRNPKQYRNSNSQNSKLLAWRLRRLRFGHWNFEIVWSLLLVIWNFRKAAGTSCFAAKRCSLLCEAAAQHESQSSKPALHARRR